MSNTTLRVLNPETDDLKPYPARNHVALRDRSRSAEAKAATIDRKLQRRFKLGR